MNKYINGKIYGLYFEERLIYVGSTTLTIEERLYDHKKSKTDPTKAKRKINIFMKENDVSKITIKLIEDYPCNSKQELNRKEGEYQKELSGLLNKEVAGRTIKEYYQDNKELFQQYYKDNFETIKQQKKERYNKLKESLALDRVKCECGVEVRRDGLNRHLKTTYHNNYVLSK